MYIYIYIYMYCIYIYVYMHLYLYVRISSTAKRCHLFARFFSISVLIFASNNKASLELKRSTIFLNFESFFEFWAEQFISFFICVFH